MRNLLYSFSITPKNEVFAKQSKAKQLKSKKGSMKKAGGGAEKKRVRRSSAASLQNGYSSSSNTDTPPRVFLSLLSSLFSLYIFFSFNLFLCIFVSLLLLIPSFFIVICGVLFVLSGGICLFC